MHLIFSSYFDNDQETTWNCRDKGDLQNMSYALSQTACRLLSDSIEFVMATIISHTGSTPRTAGTQMIITADGKITGTIGGGLLEARVIEKAVEILQTHCPYAFMPFDLSYEDVASMDMICGGHAEVFLDHIAATDENRDIYNLWDQILEGREKGYFITAIDRGGSGDEPVRHAVMNKDKRIFGQLPVVSESLSGYGIDFDRISGLKTVQVDEVLILAEPSIIPEAAFLFGAGHVSKSTAHLCAMTGFHVTVIDDRKEFANADHFPDSHEIRVIDDFENAFSDLEIDPHAFIVIFTRGHLHDRTVLAHALKTQAGYIGMIGSRRKRDNIYKALLNSGFSQQDIDRVHSPIGLAIGAQTPEEIAVSIVAEMIQKRARMPR